MKSTAYRFDGAGGVALDFGRKVEGFMTQVQCALVNIATERGSDPFVPTRGTAIFQNAVKGKLAGNSVTAEASWAALDTLFFQRGQDTSGQTPRLKNITMQVTDVRAGRVSIQCQMESTEGETVGILADI